MLARLKAKIYSGIHKMYSYQRLWNTDSLQYRFLGPIEKIKRTLREIKDYDTMMEYRCIGRLPQNQGLLHLYYLGRHCFMKDFVQFFANSTMDKPVVLEEQSTALSLWEHFLCRRKREREWLTHGNHRGLSILDDWLIFPKHQIRGYRYIPYLQGILPVERDLEKQIQRMNSKAHRRKCQMILKEPIVWRKTHQLKDFRLFYDTMYSPFAQNRFGSYAALVSRKEMEAKFIQHGFILFIFENNKPVSGAFLYVTKNNPGVLHYWKYGLAESETLTNETFGERNARTELAVMEYAIQSGFKLINFGLTRAVANDGIFTHKHRLGCFFQAVKNSPQFSFYCASPLHIALLSAHPLFLRYKEKHIAQVAHHGPLSHRKIQHLSDTLQNCCLPNMDWIELYIPPAMMNHEESKQLLIQVIHEIEKQNHIPVLLRDIYQINPPNLGEYT